MNCTRCEGTGFLNLGQVDEETLSRFDQTGDIMSLGPDDRGLFMFSANLYLHRQPINT